MGNYSDGFEVHANKITGQAKDTGVTVADMATMQLENAFTERLTENVSLLADELCGPQYRQTGSMFGRFFNAGRRQNALELLCYLLILVGFTGTALWVIGATLWLYPVFFVVSVTISLVLSLSGTGK